jgi:hypothetical protein
VKIVFPRLKTNKTVKIGLVAGLVRNWFTFANLSRDAKGASAEGQTLAAYRKYAIFSLKRISGTTRRTIIFHQKK